MDHKHIVIVLGALFFIELQTAFVLRYVSACYMQLNYAENNNAMNWQINKLAKVD